MQAVQSDPGALRALQGQLRPGNVYLAAYAEQQPQSVLRLLLGQQVGLDHLFAAQGNAQLPTDDIVYTQQLLRWSEVPVVQGVLCHVKQKHIGLAEPYLHWFQGDGWRTLALCPLRSA